METWYVLETGAFADPNECAPDAAGVLRHVSGAAVAVGPHGYRSRGMSAAEIAAARQPREEPREEPAPRRGRQMKADAGAGYETR